MERLAKALNGILPDQLDHVGQVAREVTREKDVDVDVLGGIRPAATTPAE